MHAGHTDAVRALRVVGHRLCSGSYDGTVRVWSTSTLHLERTLRCHSGPVRTLSAAGGFLFSGSYDHTVCAWSLDVSPPPPPTPPPPFRPATALCNASPVLRNSSLLPWSLSI